MPRTGSNLLSSVLNQNELLHSEGVSAMCNILWDFKLCVLKDTTSRELKAVYKDDNKKIKKIATSLFDAYYEKENKIIFDKSFSWTLEGNIDMLKNYIVEKPKIIVLTRKIEDVVKSYVNILLDNDFNQLEAEKYILNLDSFGSNPLMRPIAGIMYSKMNKDVADFIYIDYDDLISSTKNTIEEIYNFCNIPNFNHNYENIELKYPENSDVVFKNMVSVRPEIKKRKIDIKLSDRSLEKINNIESLFEKIEFSSKNKETIKEFKNFYALNTY